MSLFTPLPPKQLHSKPMAISTITLSANSQNPPRNEIYRNNSESSNSCRSSSSQSSKSDMGTSNNYLDSRAISLSPTSYSSSNYSAWSTSSSPSSLYALKNMPKPSPISGTRDGVAQASAAVHSPYGSYKHRKASSSSSISYRIDSLSSNTILSNMPLSLQERRTRNKTASAKYRAKRNQQHGEMRAMIDSLTKENELLLRQLENVQFENGHLKSTCDKLRGKIMAQKMIKQYLDESGHQQNLGDNAAAHRISYEQTTIPDLKE